MTQITNTAMESVSAKLAEFSEGLDEEEQSVLRILLAEALPGEDDDVSGFDFSRVLGPQLTASSLTFQPAQLDRVISDRFGKSSSDDGHTVGWTLIIDGMREGVGGPRY